MKLVIVESPAKARTLARYLGTEFKVLATFGHIKDLPKRGLGVEIDGGFLPHYRLLPRTRKIMPHLRETAREALNVYLATDFDREGEAIAAHVAEALGDGDIGGKIGRITFVEITKKAISEALERPRPIDQRLVSAQQARRVLDRLVGYSLSPLLWKKVIRGISAGRVQSVAVRLVVERDREIEAFVPQEYWEMWASLAKAKKVFAAKLIEYEGVKLGKLSIGTKAEAGRIAMILKDARYIVSEVESEEVARYPAPPYITATLQQDAARSHGFSPAQTMKLAQDLYEAGMITYHRTDSPHLSPLAISMLRKAIERSFGKRYLSGRPRQFRARTPRAQEAHEAIRPTSATRSPSDVRLKLSELHAKLYELITARALASQMAEARYAVTRARINAGDGPLGVFLARGSKLLFDGFLKIFKVHEAEDSDLTQPALPKLRKGEILKLLDLESRQHFTKPPPPLTEASLVRALEEKGIGRPSTYAPIIETVKERGYVRRDGRALRSSELGQIVTDLLVEHFPEIADVGFTAKMEKELDRIAEGAAQYLEVLRTFWDPFSKQLKEKEATIERREIAERPSDEACPSCGSPMVERLSRHGWFLSCSRFPTCKGAKPLVRSVGVRCPDCRVGEIVERRTRRGALFFGCSRWPTCRYASWERPHA